MALDDRSNFGLGGEIISASAKILKCDLITQDKAHNVVCNDEGVRELRVLNVDRIRCIGKSREALTKATRGSIEGVGPCLKRGKG